MSAADRFYEWLLSDHPAAVAERARRRAAYLAHEARGREGLSRFVARTEADRDAPESIRELVKTARWLLKRQADRLAAEAAESERERLARQRRDFETSRRAQGATSYRYPARYLGARAARQPIPPDPDHPAAGEESS
ncbi:MAG TPA: hypothetical protein VF933_09675 [Streptosporangiaceae bacterium]